MNDIIALLVIAAALGAALLFHAREASAWRTERSQLTDAAAAERAGLILAARAERKELEDRVMARSYQEFVYHTDKAAAPEPEQLTTDEIEAQWYEAQAREAAAADASGAHMVGVEAA